MLVSSFFLLILMIVFSVTLPNIAANLSNALHDSCVKLAPQARFQALDAAIVCAEPLHDSAMTQSFAQVGLIHFIVTSGYHLYFIEWLIQKSFRKSFAIWLTGLLFAFFVLISGFHPPVFRAFSHWLARLLNRTLKLNWTPIQSLTVSGLVSLLFCPTSDLVHSLCLSWIAGIAIHGFVSPANPELQKDHTSRLATAIHKLKTQARLYFFIAPSLISLSVPHPLAIITNWLLAPILSCTVFPMALVTFAAPAFVPLSDFFWGILTTGVPALAAEMPPHLERIAVDDWVLPLYTGFLSLLALYFERKNSCAPNPPFSPSVF